MSDRGVVVTATTDAAFEAGAKRLVRSVAEFGGGCRTHIARAGSEAPLHHNVPYAFKAFALREARAEYLLWCDTSIVVLRSLDPIWDRIAKHGAWISRNGFKNYEWTATHAYKDLFPNVPLDEARQTNRSIEHVVGGAFAINLRHKTGKAIFDEYFRLASATHCFCGPWINSNMAGFEGDLFSMRVGPCGPADVRGHRHDQTALSVLAWRYDVELTDPPEYFAYCDADSRTILHARGPE